MKKEKTWVYAMSEAHTYKDEDDAREVTSYVTLSRSMRSAKNQLKNAVALAVDCYYSGSISKADEEEIVEEILGADYFKSKALAVYRWDVGSDVYEWRITSKEI